MKPTTSEAEVQLACLDYLRLIGGVAVRTNSGGMKVDDRYVRFNSEDGCSDVLACVPHPTRGGVFVAAECKRPGWVAAGPQSKDRKRVKREADQRAFLDRVVKAGGIGLFVRSLDELRAALRLEGFDTP